MVSLTKEERHSRNDSGNKDDTAMWFSTFTTNWCHVLTFLNYYIRFPSHIVLASLRISHIKTVNVNNEEDLETMFRKNEREMYYLNTQVAAKHCKLCLMWLVPFVLLLLAVTLCSFGFQYTDLVVVLLPPRS